MVWQINETRNKNTEEASRGELADARKSYMSYSDATLKYPELTDPDDALMRDAKPLVEVSQASARN